MKTATVNINSVIIIICFALHGFIKPFVLTNTFGSTFFIISVAIGILISKILEPATELLSDKTESLFRFLIPMGV